MTSLKSLTTGILLAASLTLVAGAAKAVPSIAIVNGSSPAGYFSLGGFGIAPVANVFDDSQHHFDTPAFIFGGNVYGRINVDSNGYIVIGGLAQASQPVNQNLPDATFPNNILAPFWTDLDPDTAGEIYIAIFNFGPDQFMIVEWEDVHVKSTDETVTAQVWIQLGGPEDISFVYETIGTLPDNLTVGAEDINGTVGDTAYFNGVGTAPSTDQDLKVLAEDLADTATPTPTPIPEPGTLALFGLGLAGLGFARRRKGA